jgi:cephalosporin hydroxylase
MGDIDNFDWEAIRCRYYRYIRGRNEPRWRGVQVVKFPSDMILYAQVIQKRKPDFIIETGSAYGGSALFFGDMLELNGNGQVISIDVSDEHRHKFPKHPRVTYVKGSSVSASIIDYVKSTVGSGSVMVVLDSDHSTRHVTKELEAYSPIVTKGQYLVVEDCWTKRDKPYKPWYSVEEFLKTHPEYRRFNLEKQFMFAVTRDGWLRKIDA